MIGIMDAVGTYLTYLWTLQIFPRISERTGSQHPLLGTYIKLDGAASNINATVPCYEELSLTHFRDQVPAVTARRSIGPGGAMCASAYPCCCRVSLRSRSCEISNGYQTHIKDYCVDTN